MAEERLKFEHLPQSVLPIVYDVTIDSNLEALTFKGKVEIDCDVIEAVSEIVMNARDLEISSAVVCQNELCAIAEVTYLDEEQRIVLSLKTELSPGKVKVSMEFSGKILDGLFGYYYTPDKTHPGKNSATTQFEPADARRAFPCWDEPEFKAQFDITMIGDKELTLISNMNEISNKPLPGNENRKVVKFARTPKMSTYLVAFAAGLFEYIEKVDKNGIVHRVYADYGKMPECEKALEVSVGALECLTDFFKIDYPLPKCDSLAVERFDFGAMENWGLVIYRTSCLFVEPNGTSNYALQTVYEIISHELTHQWFGNLVTMKWWTHIWLNEGFANFIQNVVTDYLRPDFEMWTQFISDALTRALSLDSLRSSHPVEVDVGHPSEVREIFDDISYNKGCSLNRMLYFFLGKETFVRGLSNYLNHFAYSNASTSDLWKFLGEASNMDLESVMASWTRQTGFPVVIIEEMTQLTPNKRQLKLSQKRHLDDGTEDELNTIWSIPISIISQSSPKEPVSQFVMRSKTHVIEIEGVCESDWVDLNPDFVGMYLVSYPENNMKLLSNAINQSPNGEILTAESRSALLYEKLRLAISGQSTIVELLELVKCYVDDQHFLIWNIVIEVFSCLNPIFYGSGCDSSKVDKFKMEVFEKIASKIGVEKNEGETESHLTEMLRTMIMFQMGKLGHPETVTYCRSLFDNFAKNNEPICPKIRDSVLKVVGANTLDKEELDVLISLYKSSSSNEEKRGLLRGMGCVKGKELALRVVEFVISDQIPNGDQNYAFEYLGYDMELGEFLLNYCEENFEKVRDATGGIESRSLNFVLKMCSNPFCKVEDLAPAERIFKTHKFDRFKRALAQNKEAVSIREVVIAREGKALKAYFDKL